MISVRLACFRYRTQIFLSAATTAIVDLSRVGNSLEHILLSEAKMRTFEIACKCICLRAQACDTVPGESSVCHQAESHQVSKHLKTKSWDPDQHSQLQGYSLTWLAWLVPTRRLRVNRHGRRCGRRARLRYYIQYQNALTL